MVETPITSLRELSRRNITIKSKRKQLATLQLVNGLRPLFHKLALRNLLLLLRALAL